MKRSKFSSALLSLGVCLYILDVSATANASDEHISTPLSVNTVRVIVNERYGSLPNLSLPFQQLAIEILKSARFQIVGADAKNYDATLEINVQGNAIPAVYTLSGRPLLPPEYTSPGDSSLPGDLYEGIHYTGVSIEGVISLEIHSDPVNRDSSLFRESRRVEPIHYSYPDPASAPWMQVFDVLKLSFIRSLGQLIAGIYDLDAIIPTLTNCGARYKYTSPQGHVQQFDLDCVFVMADLFLAIGDSAFQPLIDALSHKDSKVQRNAANILGRTGDTRAVVPLIDALTEDDYKVRHSINAALTEITGMYYYKQEDWHRWWEEKK